MHIRDIETEQQFLVQSLAYNYITKVFVLEWKKRFKKENWLKDTLRKSARIMHFMGKVNQLRGCCFLIELITGVFFSLTQGTSISQASTILKMQVTENPLLGHCPQTNKRIQLQTNTISRTQKTKENKHYKIPKIKQIFVQKAISSTCRTPANKYIQNMQTVQRIFRNAKGTINHARHNKIASNVTKSRKHIPRGNKQGRCT